MDEKREKRVKRHRRIRRKIFGSKTKPRLCVYRGLANMHAQLIDDLNEQTMICVSTHNKDFRKKMPFGGNIKAAVFLGEILAERAKNKKITEVVFDRAGFRYHGRIKALAESARKHGLKF